MNAIRSCVIRSISIKTEIIGLSDPNGKEEVFKSSTIFAGGFAPSDTIFL